MVQRLLDWHPEIIALPPETPLLEKYFRLSGDERGRYFRSTFLTPAEGKQAQFVDEEFREKLGGEMERQFSINTSRLLAFDPAAFREAYDDSLEGDDDLLSRVIRALSRGILAGVPTVRDRCPSPRYLAHKRPYYSELHATEITEIAPESRFLHVVRSPLSQYASFKARRANLGRSGPLNGIDFVTSSCRTWALSRKLADSNLASLGPDRYRVIHYEDLVRDPRPVMTGVAEWLRIPFDESLTETTWMGHGIGANSSFSGLSRDDGRPPDPYRAVTNSGERALISYLLRSVHDLLGRYEEEVPHTSRMRARLSWALKWRGETAEAHRDRKRSPFNPTALRREELSDVLVGKRREIPRDEDVQFF